jgi:hypothetical protein
MNKIAKPRFAAAKARSDARMKGPRAEAVIYDAHRNRIVVTLTTGIDIGFGPEYAQGLQRLTLRFATRSTPKASTSTPKRRRANHLGAFPYPTVGHLYHVL